MAGWSECQGWGLCIRTSVEKNLPLAKVDVGVVEAAARLQFEVRRVGVRKLVTRPKCRSQLDFGDACAGTQAGVF